MWKKSDGFLLSEVLLAMFIVVVGILFIVESLVSLRAQTIQQQDMLEMSILASEILKFELTSEDVTLQEKCREQHIELIESSDQQLILEKNGHVLNISRE